MRIIKGDSFPTSNRSMANCFITVSEHDEFDINSVPDELLSAARTEINCIIL